MACSNCNSNLTVQTCNNPCGVTQTNTPACESLPSQIQNFTTQFFGEVIKTELNGEVVWSLPCSLDIGLPNNPRGVDEGLACYFLRLFRDGIGGLTGPRGLTGTPGVDGANAYTVTVQSFAQPTISTPLVQIVILPNPCVVEGVGIFVEYSGIYQVTGVASGGVVFATFVSSVASPLATIPSGAKVVPMWAASAGPQGPQGPQGIQGTPGQSYPGENGLMSACQSDGSAKPGAIFWAIPAAMSVIDFIEEKMEFAPAQAGLYLVNAVISLTGQATVVPTDEVDARLETSDGIIYGQSMVYVNQVGVGQYVNVFVTSVVQTTGAAGQTVQVKARLTSGAPFSVTIDPQGSMLTWVRLS